MAQDAFDSVTKSPASRRNAAKATGSQSGPVAPSQPKAPVVPGASSSNGEAQPFLLQQNTQPRHIQPKRQPQASQTRQQMLTLNMDGVERRAILLAPQSAAKTAAPKKNRPAQKLPLIIFLHGAGGSASQAMRQTGLGERAAAAGFLAVFPEGLGPEGGQTWNAWMCCGYARDQKIDDVGFLSALIARLRGDFGADPRRVYLAGFSNGAMLASRYALERPGAAAALISVAGYLPCDAERPSENLPVLVIHGSRDGVARFGPTEAHPATGRYCEDYPARAQVDFWVRGMNLSPKAQVQESRKSPLRVEDYGPAQRGGRGSVRFVIVQGGGHAWPGGARERYRYCDAPMAGVDATGMVLDFCRRQPSGVPQAQDSAAASVKKKKARP